MIWERKYSYWFDDPKWSVGIVVHPESDCVLTGKVEFGDGSELIEIAEIAKNDIDNEALAKAIADDMNGKEHP